MARKSDLTPELQKQLIDLLQSGIPIADACAHVGITDRSYYYWMQKGEAGRKGHEKYVQFFHAATRARVNARISAVVMIRRSIQEGNTDDARWFLERSDPANWGRRDKLTIEGGLSIDIINQTIRALEDAGMSASEIFHELIREAAEQQRVSATSDSAGGG